MTPKGADGLLCEIMRAVNPISEHFREQAAAHRERAADHPDDPRYEHSAQALEALADHADASAERDAFQMRYLLEHHVIDGRFAWTGGQCGRSVLQFGFDVPVRGEDELDQFLMDLCDRAKSDAARHIGENESAFHRDDGLAIATRFGIDVDRVHAALDAGRGYRQLFVVGIPAEHPIDAGARAQLEAIDGAIVAPGSIEAYGEAPPLLVKNVPAVDTAAARARVATIVAIDPEALGATASPRVLT
ncbi:MAG TPA: hypothetical protein VNA28_11725 [Solirubrobacteraceae bacterium]|nr:hypothetical protein [Solirubrobacteraceae bacterium]